MQHFETPRSSLYTFEALKNIGLKIVRISPVIVLGPLDRLSDFYASS